MAGTIGLVVGAAGIYASFLYYGSLQEDVFAFKDPDGNHFHQVWLLQAIEALANAILGFTGMMITGRTAGLPMNLFAMSGTTQVAAKACMSLALASGLSFPVVTLAKSAKMAPVMAGGILIGGKRYPLRQYLQVAAIIAGAVMVSMKSSKPGGKASSGLGVAYIVLSLACDGLTGGVQDRVKLTTKEKGVKVKPYDMMFWSNVFMCLVASAASLLLGQAFSGWLFIMANPAIMWKVLAFACVSATGQSFIFYVVAEFGALKCATVTTTRKILSVLLSIFTKGHAVSPVGWLGILLGACGIVGELIPEKKQQETRQVKIEDQVTRLITAAAGLSSEEAEGVSLQGVDLEKQKDKSETELANSFVSGSTGAGGTGSDSGAWTRQSTVEPVAAAEPQSTAERGATP